MRHRRRLLADIVAAIVFTSVCAAPAAWAQEAKLFQNSWFWGVHGGTTSIGTPLSSKQAGTIGGEWMITRSNVGLYVAYDQSSFHMMSQIADPSTASGMRPVAISGMRSGSIAMMAFPGQFGSFRPYGALGMQINVIATATAQVDTSSGTAPGQDVISATDDARSRSAPFVMFGGQWQRQRVALFGQISLSPSTDQFLLNSSMTSISFGVRYNFGRSIEM